MIPTEVSIRGILRADGTLELSERPGLPEGPVDVVIKAVPKAEAGPEGEDLLAYIRRARAELEAAGSRFRTKEEIDAQLAEDRDWNEERFEAIYREVEASRRRDGDAG